MDKLTGWQCLLPAYGRDYKNAKDAKKDFQDGKDFLLQPANCYCSVRDFAPGSSAEIRYSKLTKFVVVKL